MKISSFRTFFSALAVIVISASASFALRAPIAPPSDPDSSQGSFLRMMMGAAPGTGENDFKSTQHSLQAISEKLDVIAGNIGGGSPSPLAGTGYSMLDINGNGAIDSDSNVGSDTDYLNLIDVSDCYITPTSNIIDPTVAGTTRTENEIKNYLNDLCLAGEEAFDFNNDGSFTAGDAMTLRDVVAGTDTDAAHISRVEGFDAKHEQAKDQYLPAALQMYKAIYYPNSTAATAGGIMPGGIYYNGFRLMVLP